MKGVSRDVRFTPKSGPGFKSATWCYGCIANFKKISRCRRSA